MSKSKITIVCLLTLLLSAGAKAQRHYAGVSALELNYGLNIFGEPNTNLSFSISKYKSRTTYWKGGFNYLENSFSYKTPLQINEGVEPEYITHYSTAKNFYGNIIFFKTLTTNLTSFYLNGGIGAFLGAETYKNPEQQFQFLLGPEIDLEAEFFVSSRVALMGRVTQYWNPFSDIKKWNTIWNVGVKFLIY